MFSEAIFGEFFNSRKILTHPSIAHFLILNHLCNFLVSEIPTLYIIISRAQITFLIKLTMSKFRNLQRRLVF